MEHDVYEAARGLLRALKATLHNCRHCMECGDSALDAEADRAIAEAERVGIVAPPEEEQPSHTKVMVEALLGPVVPGRADAPSVPITILKPGPFRVVRLVVKANGEHTVHLDSARDSGYVTWGGPPAFWGELVKAYDTGEEITAERLRAFARAD
jgi:hypothetical protein